MTEQKCVRTYDKDFDYASVTCNKDLNLYLKCGWKVVMVTPKAEYNEYIIEREIDNSRME